MFACAPVVFGVNQQSFAIFHEQTHGQRWHLQTRTSALSVRSGCWNNKYQQLRAYMRTHSLRAPDFFVCVDDVVVFSKVFIMTPASLI